MEIDRMGLLAAWKALKQATYKPEQALYKPNLLSKPVKPTNAYNC